MTSVVTLAVSEASDVSPSRIYKIGDGSYEVLWDCHSGDEQPPPPECYTRVRCVPWGTGTAEARRPTDALYAFEVWLQIHEMSQLDLLFEPGKSPVTRFIMWLGSLPLTGQDPCDSVSVRSLTSDDPLDAYGDGISAKLMSFVTFVVLRLGEGSRPMAECLWKSALLWMVRHLPLCTPLKLELVSVRTYLK